MLRYRPLIRRAQRALASASVCSRRQPARGAMPSVGAVGQMEVDIAAFRPFGASVDKGDSSIPRYGDVDAFTGATTEASSKVRVHPKFGGNIPRPVGLEEEKGKESSGFLSWLFGESKQGKSTRRDHKRNGWDDMEPLESGSSLDWAAQGGGYTSAASRLSSRSSSPAVSPFASSHILDVVRITKRGRLTVLQESKTNLANETGVEIRDLRSVDPHFSNGMPCILQRGESIIFNMLGIRAIVLPESVLVFNPFAPLTQEMLPALQERVRQDSQIPDAVGQPLEFRALEALLLSVSNTLEADYQNVEPRIRNMLSHLSQPDMASRNLLRDLLPLNIEIDDFLRRRNDAAEAVTELLERDEDLAGLYISQDYRRQTQDHEDAEILLESYLMRIQALHGAVEQRQRDLSTTEAVVNLTLDTTRNRMLRLEIVLALLTASAAVSGLTAAAFGMNLVTGLEEDPEAFAKVTGGMIFSTMALFSSGVAYSKHIKIL